MNRGVWGWGGDDWGTKCLLRQPLPSLTPIGAPIQQSPSGEGVFGMSNSGHMATAPSSPMETKAVPLGQGKKCNVLRLNVLGVLLF